MEERIRQLHLEAGLRCGREHTCGNKQAYEGEADAGRAAVAHNRWTERKHDVEPYPCAFCERWHIGRIMTVDELEAIIAR